MLQHIIQNGGTVSIQGPVRVFVWLAVKMIVTVVLCIDTRG